MSAIAAALLGIVIFIEYRRKLPNVDEVVWRFFPSVRSNRVGPTTGQTGDAFREVVIDGTTRGAASNGGEAADGTDRCHLARGHFKTFTEGAPLLGKHAGTYWWGWQVRGQEGSGVIEKTYTLRAPGDIRGNGAPRLTLPR
ncbi:hypothetical protein ACW0JT_14530 [Arthrobacter sp. SA17]